MPVRRNSITILVSALAALLAAVALPASASATWNQPVGGANPINQADNRDGNFVPDVASIGGIPYVAWPEDDGTSSEIRVARLNAAGTDWEQPWTGVSATSGGINQATDKEASHPSLADVGGVPYVAWREFDGGNYEIRVARLNAAGTAWEQVSTLATATWGGVNDLTGRNGISPSMASIGGVPHVAWAEDDGTNLEVRVSRLNAAGTAWQQVVGGENPINSSSTKSATDPQLASVGGVPYVAWAEIDGANYEIRVARLNATGTSWVEGPPWTGVSATYGGIKQATDRDGLDPSLASIGGVPYVAWSETDGTNREVRVSRLNAAGTAWEQVVGGASPVNQADNRDGQDPSLADVAGVPYVAWSETDGTNEEVRVSRLNAAGTAWAQVVGGASPINQANNRPGKLTSLAAVNTVPYVGWYEFDGTNDEFRVSRLEPEFTAATATPTETGATLSADVHTYGIPYSVGFQYGTALESETPPQTTTIGAENATVTRQVDGLSPATEHQFRPFATAGVPAPRVLGATSSFTTLGTDPGAGGADTSGPNLELGGKRKQELPKVKVTATCADEPCDLEATGKLALPGGKSKNAAKALTLRSASADAAAGEPVKLKLKLAKKGLKTASRALGEGDKAKAKLTVVATDAAGNATTRTRKVTVVE